VNLVPAEGALLAQILDATYPLWNEGLSPSAYDRWWQAQLLTAWGRKHLRRYALAEGDLVLASAKRYDLDAVAGDRRLRVMGIGAVFTQPHARGRGAARVLVERMLEAGTREGFDAALLFSKIGPGYYARLGFEPVPLYEQHIAVIEKPGAPATLVRAGDDRDLEPIAAIGQVRSAPFRFHLDRNAELVQFAIVKQRLLAGLGSHGARELQFFIAEEGTSAVAYVVLSVHGGEWRIEECGDRDPAGARVGAILQVLLAREPGEKRPAICGLLPPGFVPPQITIAEERPAAEIMMMRSLAGTPIPTLERRDVLYWHADVF
jgi:GNAT superfamily N-acetyltransferase